MSYIHSAHIIAAALQNVYLVIVSVIS